MPDVLTSLKDAPRVLIEADLKPRLSIGREIGSPYLLAIAPRAPGLATSRAMPGTRDALEVARDRAAVMGIGIAFEFLGFRDSPINTPELAAETVDRIDGIGLVLDSCHWHASGSGPLEVFPVERLAMVHLNDAPRKPPAMIEDADRLLPGLGVIRLPSLVASLRERLYRGPWSLETFNPSYWREDPEGLVRRGAAALDALLGEEA